MSENRHPLVQKMIDICNTDTQENDRLEIQDMMEPLNNMDIDSIVNLLRAMGLTDKDIKNLMNS